MTAKRLTAALVTLLAGAVVAFLAIRYRTGAQPPGFSGPEPGGRLVATYRSEPRTFNRFVSPNTAEELITRLTQATLVRVNRATGAIEPRLAERWTMAPDGMTWTLHLRQGVTFSDGAPFTAADVTFSFLVATDPAIKSALAGSLKVGDQPITLRATDEATVVVTLPAPYGPGLALLDGLPIVPQHKLRASYEAGQFASAWGVTTPLADIVGLGPFVLTEYAAGTRLALARNARYWRTDQAGRRLPYLDAIELQIVPDQDAEVLRLESGDVDLITDQVRAEDVASLRAAAARGAVTLADAGVSISPDMLWFNLTPGSPRAARRPWLQRQELRRALSHAVDRQAIVDTVYLGAADPIWGPVTPGHGEWFLRDLPKTDFDPARAASLLRSIGLTDRTGDGLVDDAAGATARIALLTVKGRTVTERTAAMVQEQARRVGLALDIVPMELGAMVGAWGKGDYDAVLFRITHDSADPARAQEFWMSSGAFHVWHPGQAAPATPWEAAIDEHMRRQATTTDGARRREAFGAAQRVFAAELPVLYFAAPRVLVATSTRVGGAVPAVVPPPVLWNAEALFVVPRSGARR